MFKGNVGNVLARVITGSAGQTLYARVRGLDCAGNISAWSQNSDGITVDLARPRLTGLTAPNYATLQITFNEPVVNADKAVNYSCTSGLRILGVRPLSASQYRLYTNDQRTGTSYTVTVKSGVRDRASNPVDPAYSARSFQGGPRTSVRTWQFYK